MSYTQVTTLLTLKLTLVVFAVRQWSLPAQVFPFVVEVCVVYHKQVNLSVERLIALERHIVHRLSRITSAMCFIHCAQENHIQSCDASAHTVVGVGAKWLRPLQHSAKAGKQVDFST